jgi:hypothetical protein
VNARRLAVLGVPVLLVAAVAGVVLTGGPTPGGLDAPGADTATPTDASGGSTTDGGAVTSDGGAGSVTATQTRTGTPTEAPTSTSTATPPFAFTVDSIEECGTTCREATSTLTNRQGEAASDVAVTTHIYAGNGTDGDVVWEGSEQVGRLDAGESYTATRRVELSYGEAFKVQNEGWVTVETTVRTADRTLTFSDRRQVA